MNQSAFGRPSVDLVVRGRLVTCAETPPAGASGPLAVLEDGMLAISKGRIAYVGPAIEMPATETVVASGCVLPGLIDPHTHLVFAGSRVREVAARFAGASYEELARAGGGIMSTVRATREASDETLLQGALARAEALRACGVTTIEAKSGYGLTTHDELRLLQTARAVEEAGVARIEATFLGAHAVPTGRRREDYLLEVVHDQLPEVLAQGIARHCDVYCDRSAFTVEETRQVLSAAKAGGLRVRAHIGQFADIGGAQLLAELGGLSGDHLEELTDDGLAAMAQGGVTAVFLPGAWSTLRQEAPDAARFRKAGVPVAIGTDLNPGTSPLTDLWLAAAMAVRDAGLTMEEAILGITRHAARSLGLSDRGVLKVGAVADFALFREEDPRALVYALGGGRAEQVYLDGRATLSPSPVGSPAIW